MENKNSDIHRYDDIIQLPHHVSKTHPQMPVSDRAAQFAPFAALTGHDAAIRETARLTEEKAELDENAKMIIDEKLRFVQETLSDQPKVTVTYFKQKEKKAGGKYITVSGSVRKIDMYKGLIIMMDDISIPFVDIYDIEGEIFGNRDYEIL